jgi:hypothetical protein
VRLLHDVSAVRAVFDDRSLVSCAGLVPVMRLAQNTGLHDLVGEAVRLPGSIGSNPAGKVASIVAGMIAGADSIGDLDVVRHGGLNGLFGGVYASSTLGSFLRQFTFGHVKQVESVSHRLLARLVGRVPLLLPDTEAVTFVDVDSVLRRVYGKAKQGAGFGHTKVGGYQVRLRGLNPLVATMSTPHSAPLVAATQMRAGNAGSARGAAKLVATAVRDAKAVRPDATVIVRADAAFYSRTVIWAAIGNGARFSITVKQDVKVKAAIAAIGDDAWVGIKYPKAIWDEDEQRWISEAQIAEISYTAFAGTRHKVTARLIVRRVRRRDPKAHAGQEELFATWRYHALFTDSAHHLVQAEGEHRAHAVVEQVFADLINGPLAHLPSGSFAANGAWLSLAGIAHNLTRAAGCLAGASMATARSATIRRKIVNVAAKIVRHSRTLTLRLPQHWPWQRQWRQLFVNTHAPPTG